MAARAEHPHLRIITDSGELLDEHPEIQGLQDEVRGLKRDVATWQRRYAQLRREKEAEARAGQLWPVAVRIYRAWQLATGHTRAAFNYDRFALVEPHLKKRDYGILVCLRAVAGIAYDHYERPRKNGSVRRFDEWERCFKDAAAVEERANSAPEGWRGEYPFTVALESLAPWLAKERERCLTKRSRSTAATAGTASMAERTSRRPSHSATSRESGAPSTSAG